jgi:hypothetical protein
MRRVVCERTGLALAPSPAHPVFRIAKVPYGPMTPPLRPHGGLRDGWGRWDVAGGHTIYGGSPEECAYAETLAWARPAISIALSELFDPSQGETEEDLTGITLADAASRRVVRAPPHAERQHGAQMAR